MMTDEATMICRSCAKELTQRDVREIIDNHGRPHGPFCASCAQSAEGIPFDQWLDEQWQRQNRH
jgi:hypothetical protein